MIAQAQLLEKAEAMLRNVVNTSIPHDTCTNVYLINGNMVGHCLYLVREIRKELGLEPLKLHSAERWGEQQ